MVVDNLDILYEQYTIRNRIETIAHFLNEDYKDDDNVVLLCVLKGAVNFFSDLALMLSFDAEYEFVGVKSYEGTETTGDPCLTTELPNLEGKKVLIVEDIVDTGLTANYLKSLLQEAADDVKLCTLLSKPSRRIIDIEPDYVAFEIDDLFVVGYGLDYNQKYRNLPYIAVLENSTQTRANLGTINYNNNVNQQ